MRGPGRYVPLNMHGRKNPIIRNLLISAVLFFLIGLLMSPRVPAAIQKTLEANTQVARQSGRPLLSFNWFADGHLGVLSYTLKWAQPSQLLLSSEFRLARAGAFRWAAPALPTGCQLVHLNGKLNRQERTPFHGLSLTFRGNSCEPFLSELKMGEVQIEFQDVPHTSPTGAEGVTPLLVLKIDVGSPANSQLNRSMGPD